MMMMCKQARRQVVRYYDDVYADYYNSDDFNLNYDAADDDDNVNDNDNIIYVIYKGRSRRSKSRR